MQNLENENFINEQVNLLLAKAHLHTNGCESVAFLTELMGLYSYHTLEECLVPVIIND